MNQIYYISSIHSSDSNTVSARITYYIGVNNLLVEEHDSGMLISSNNSITDSDVIIIDSAMASLGYLRP
jgi:calcineurin-like phosphoesterase family protein